MNGYNLIRAWYDFKFDNPDKVRHLHSDFYCYLVDQWNRLGQKEKFGLPTKMTMEVLGIGSYNTYKKSLDDLIDFGFVLLVQDSKNQHHSKVVALSKIDKATDKPLDKATIKASNEAIDKPTDTIDKPLNKGTKNKETKKQYDPLAIEVLAEFNRITGREFKNSKNSLQPIQARLREGFTKEQAVLVIESKFKEWGTDLKMQQYVRPETIFNGKFDSYLQAANALKPKVKKHNFGAFNNKADYLFWCNEIVKEQPQEWEE